MDKITCNEIFEKFNKLKEFEKISKKDLLNIIQPLSKTVSVYDLSIATSVLRESGKYIQMNYREKYLEIYIKYFILRLKDINQDKNVYGCYLNKDELFDSINILKIQMLEEINEHTNDKFPLIYTLIGLYTTYILQEPIHPVGTPFPGNMEVTFENNAFRCPVKKNNENNPKAVCKFCIAEQTDLD
ncbi:MAG: DUF2115 domain-containing protein [Methanobrevibacter sp.]|nr:DUF2115 domain-containing protein [Methanobrevibacter sp.]